MCTSPLFIRSYGIDGTKTMLIPCGKCAECLKQKQNDYMVRIYEELMQVNKACFVTLTYSNSNVPFFEVDGKKYLTVWKQDIKDWIKRFRTNYERLTGVKGIRYFLCSEYGPKTKRPHYHCIFFGLDKNDIYLALQDWQARFGFTLAKDIDYSEQKSLECSARYVSKYACKGFLENPFCSESESPAVFSTFLQRSWQDVYKSASLVPFIFILSSLETLRNSTRKGKFATSCIRNGLFGRGVKAEMC